MIFDHRVRSEKSFLFHVGDLGDASTVNAIVNAVSLGQPQPAGLGAKATELFKKLNTHVAEIRSVRSVVVMIVLVLVGGGGGGGRFWRE